MSYNYQNEKSYLLTDEGQRAFLKFRDKVCGLIKASGAVQQTALPSFGGTSWHDLAMVDRMVELGELVEIPNPISQAGQHRIFIEPYRRG
jgi:hypothetical protein